MATYNQLIDRSFKALGTNRQEFIQDLIVAAKLGDSRALSIVASHIIPPVKPQPIGTPFKFPQEGTLIDKMDALVLAMSTGKLSVEYGCLLMKSYADVLSVLKVDLLTEEVEKLKSHANIPKEVGSS